MVSQRRGPNRMRGSRRGAAAVELALITPLMVTILLGCIDFGRYPSTAIAVRNAARVGAEYASNNPPGASEAAQADWRDQTKKAVEDEMKGHHNFDPKQLVVNGPTRTDLGGGRFQVQVEVVYPFRTLVDWNWPGLGLPSRVDAQQVVVMEENRYFYTPYAQ
jgi:Flp pilus assembly protein TadG